MARKNFVLETLLDKGVVSWKPHGNSMTPKINSGDQVVVKMVSASACRVGDAVYAKVKGSYYLHLLSAIDETHGRYQISNNHGHVNGWVNADAVYGVCVQVKDKVILTDEDLKKRMLSEPRPQVGDEVSVPWWNNGKRVGNLQGYITRIDGAYHYVKITSTDKYDVLELYETEFQIIRNNLASPQGC